MIRSDSDEARLSRIEGMSRLPYSVDILIVIAIDPGGTSTDSWGYCKGQSQEFGISNDDLEAIIANNFVPNGSVQEKTLIIPGLEVISRAQHQLPIHRTTFFTILQPCLPPCKLTLGIDRHLLPRAQPLNLRIQQYTALVSVKTLGMNSLVPAGTQHQLSFCRLGDRR